MQMPRGGHPGVPYRKNNRATEVAKPKPKKQNDDRNIWDDPETNGQAFYEKADFREFLACVSSKMIKREQGYGELKRKLGKKIDQPWPYEQWFAAALHLLQDDHAIEYLNKKFDLKLKRVYSKEMGVRTCYTTAAPPVKHYKRIRYVGGAIVEMA